MSPDRGVAEGPDGKPRCSWGLSAPEYVDYHDNEWGRPVHGENELFVLNAESVQRYSRDPSSDFWTRTKITDEHKKCSHEYTESDIKGPKMPHLPPRGEWCDLAVHLPTAGGKTTLYVACTSVNGSALMVGISTHSRSFSSYAC